MLSVCLYVETNLHHKDIHLPVKHMNNLMHCFFISKANVVITAKGSNLDCIMDQGKIRITGITFSKGNNREQ